MQLDGYHETNDDQQTEPLHVKDYNRSSGPLYWSIQVLIMRSMI
jgi:hypothetical protein